jgi:hypothetical protein
MFEGYLFWCCGWFLCSGEHLHPCSFSNESRAAAAFIQADFLLQLKNRSMTMLFI